MRGATRREHEMRDDTIYDERNVRRAMEGSDFRGTEITTNPLEAYARYLVEWGWAESPPALPRSHQIMA